MEVTIKQGNATYFSMQTAATGNKIDKLMDALLMLKEKTNDELTKLVKEQQKQETITVKDSDESSSGRIFLNISYLNNSVYNLYFRWLTNMYHEFLQLNIKLRRLRHNL